MQRLRDKRPMTDIGMIRIISTTAAPVPAGHYVQGAEAAGLLYVSGQLPIEPDGTLRADLPFAMQAELALANALAIVVASGRSIDSIVKSTIYIVDVANWPQANAAFAQALGAHRPARAIVPVPQLHHGALIEVEIIAA
jgi:2-iminobutanoate/2-iminopropanoate deaminase